MEYTLEQALEQIAALEQQVIALTNQKAVLEQELALLSDQPLASDADWQGWQIAMVSNPSFNLFRSSVSTLQADNLSIIYSLLTQVVDKPDSVNTIAYLWSQTVSNVDSSTREEWKTLAIQYNLPLEFTQVL